MTQDINGIIYNRRSQPVANAVISIIQATASVQDIGLMTNDNGQFFFDDLPYGRYTIQIFYGSDQVIAYRFQVPLQQLPLQIRVP